MPLLETVLELLPRLSWTVPELTQHRRRELAAALRSTVGRSVWHRDRLGSVRIDDLDPDDLSALPTMTKHDLMASWDDIVTDPRLTLELARTHLDGIDERGLDLLHGEYFIFTSGGSSGEPGLFCWSKAEMARWGASSIRWSAAAGGSPPQRPACIGARSLRHPSAVAAVLMTDGDPDLIVPVDQPLGAIVDRLNAVQPDAMVVLCSMLPALADVARRGELRIQLHSISVFGDVLDPKAAAGAAEVFGVAPLESYPTTDVGYIAQQAPGERGLYVNDDLLIVEPVDAADRPVPHGEMTDHLLVTSLHQRTLPLIRYRIDDRVLFDPTPGRFHPYRRIALIDGRSDDVFRYPDVTLHPHVFRSAIGRHLDVRDYEVCQTAAGAAVQVEAPGTFDADGLTHDLRLALERAGLSQPDVSVTVVGSLRRTTVGKRRHFIPTTLDPPRAHPC